VEQRVTHTAPDCLSIEALELECIVGIHPAERKRPQRVRLDIVLRLELARAGRSGRFAHTVDYSLVVEEVSRLLHFREYRLVEMATEEIAGMLMAAHPLLDSVSIRLEKPEALGGRARTAAISVTRSRSAFMPRSQDTGAVRTDIVLETQEALIASVTLAPGATLDCAAAGRPRAIAWLCSGSLLLEGARRLQVGASLPLGVRLVAGPEGARLLRCALPAG
jgi:dihydroneopterin aldolase